MHAGWVYYGLIRWHVFSSSYVCTIYSIILFAGISELVVSSVLHVQIPRRPWQKMLGAVSNPKQLIDTYLMFRQLLGNDV